MNETIQETNKIFIEIVRSQNDHFYLSVSDLIGKYDYFLMFHTLKDCLDCLRKLSIPDFSLSELLEKGHIEINEK